MSTPEDEDIVYEDPIEAISDNKKSIKKNLDLIDHALNENFHRVDDTISIGGINRVIGNILSEDIESELKREAVSRAIIQVIRYYYEGEGTEDLDEELKEWFKQSNIKFEAEIDESRIFDQLGKKGWMDIETDFVLDQDLQYFQHYVETIDNQLEFRSTAQGVVSLIHHLLDQVETGVEYIRISKTDLDSIQERLDELYEAVEQNEELKSLLTEELEATDSIEKEDLANLTEEEITKLLINKDENKEK